MAAPTVPERPPAAPLLWDAPVADGPVRATVHVPGSKSGTNRALVLAAAAGDVSVLRAPLVARDTRLMAGALRSLGVRVDDASGPGGTRTWTVTPGPLGAATLDVGNAGTAARFLPPLACLADGDVALDGDPRIRERPLRPLLDALRALGASLDDGGRGALPVVVHGRGGIAGGAVTLDASQSSQLISGLLLAGARFDAGVTVRHAGPRLPSRPFLAMTVAALRARGASVVAPEDPGGGPDVWQVAPGPLRGGVEDIEPDLSTATAFACAAAATAGRVTVAGWPIASLQPGTALPRLLEAFGATTTLDAGGLTVVGPDRLTGVDLDLSDHPESAPTLAALALFADGPSRLSGIAHLRLQETDRLAACREEFGRLGAHVEETADGLVIHPAPLHGAVLDPRADHRLAMAYALIGLRVPGVRISDIATTGKTLPDFPDRWGAMLAAAQPDPTVAPA
ncbi:MAG TPA: 3-phosphoshikimate 1-carboxyvinyltransferase [Frankiaceae bacterium]